MQWVRPARSWTQVEKTQDSFAFLFLSFQSLIQPGTPWTDWHHLAYLGIHYSEVNVVELAFI